MSDIDVVNSSGDPYFMRLTDRVKMYLSDPDVSFLVGRLRRGGFDTVIGTITLQCMDELGWYIEVGISKPQVIEWEVLESLLSSWGQYVGEYYTQVMHLARQHTQILLHDLFRIPLFDWNNNALDLDDLERRSRLIYDFLHKSSNSQDLATASFSSGPQQRYQRRLSENRTRKHNSHCAYTNLL